MRRELIRVREETGKEIRLVNVLLTSSMDSYLGTVTTSTKRAKFFVAQHVDHKKQDTNILFAISAGELSYSEATFWEGQRSAAMKQMRIFTYMGWGLAAMVAFFFSLTMIAGLLISIVVVPVLLLSKFFMAKIWGRLRKLNTEAEMTHFIESCEAEQLQSQLIAS